MFQAVPLPIIRSTKLYIQRQVLSNCTLETRYSCFSYMHFVLICIEVVLYCFVVCLCACVCMSGFCNVCVCEGFVMCVCVFDNMYTVL